MKWFKKLTEIYLLFYLVFSTGSFYHSMTSEVRISSYIMLGGLSLGWLYVIIFKGYKFHTPDHFLIYALFLASGASSLVHSVNFMFSLAEFYIWIITLFIFLGVINLVAYGWGEYSLRNSALFLGAVFNAAKLYEIATVYLVRSDICDRGIDSPNKTAAFASIILLVSLSLVLERDDLKKRILPFVLMGSSLLIVIATGSRGGIGALSAGVLVVLGVHIVYGNLAKFKERAAIFFSSTLLVGVPLVSILFTRPQSCVSQWNGGNFFGRYDMWNFGLQIFSQFPIFGSGLNTFQFLALPIYKSISLTAHAHNIFLNIAAERGLVGLVAAAALLLVVIKTLLFDVIEPWRKAAGLGLLALFLVHGLVDVPMKEPYLMRYFVLMMGLMMAPVKILRAPKKVEA